MRDAWKSGIEWYMYITNSERKAKFGHVIMTVKNQLRSINTVGDLLHHYTEPSSLVRDTAKRLYPQDWWLATQQVEDAAYGLRCIEISTGRTVDLAHGMPSRWFVETVA